jgi:hypothetical protein
LPGRKLDPSEHAAATIVAGLVHGRAEPRDIDEASEGTHDFGIDLSDGCRIALEVTAADDQDIRSVNEAGLGNEWPGPGLANDWWVVIGHVTEGPQVRIVKVMKRIVPALLVLEQNSVEDVDTRVRPAYRRPLPDTRQDVLGAMTKLHELGVSAARPWGARQGLEAKLFVSFNAGFGSDPDKLTELVAMLAERKVKKLAASGADENHLFVWLRATYPGAEIAMALGPPPAIAPEIPEAIDVIWLATTGSAATGQLQRLWRLTPPGAWEDVNVSAVRF